MKVPFKNHPAETSDNPKSSKQSGQLTAESYRNEAQGERVENGKRSGQTSGQREIVGVFAMTVCFIHHYWCGKAESRLSVKKLCFIESDFWTHPDILGEWAFYFSICLFYVNGSPYFHFIDSIKQIFVPG